KNLTIESVICSKHFKDSDFFETPCGQQYLKPGTIPLFIEETEKHEEMNVDQSNHLTLDEKFDNLDLECFRGDIEKAKLCWKIVETIKANNRKRLHTLHRTNRRLRSRLHKWTNEWKQLENQNIE
ncbi:unnamed protein product, partial [Callosobruchus maculatus]